VDGGSQLKGYISQGEDSMNGFLIVAVLVLLGVTRLYKPELVKYPRRLRLATWWLIVSVVIAAVGQLIMIMTAGTSERADTVLLTNAAILGALAVSLFLWQKALAGDDKQDQDRQ
jgi:hypothetical protein